MTRGLLRLLLLLLVVAVRADPVEAADVLAAADGRHVFVVRPGVETEGWEVVHFDAASGPEAHRTVFRTPRRPEAIAASDDRCILVLAPVDATLPVRLGVSFRVVQHPLNDVWYADPPGDPRVLPPIPEGGDVAGVIASGPARYLVFTPSQRAARGVSRPDAEVAPSVEDLSVTGGIFRTDDDRAVEWRRIGPPEGFEQAIRVVAGQASTDQGSVPVVVWVDAAETWHVADRRADAWDESTVGPTESGMPVSIAPLGDRTVVGIRTVDGLQLEDLIADSAGGWRLRPFARVATPRTSANAVVLGTSAGLWVVGLDGGDVTVTVVDRVDGTTRGPIVAAEVDVDGSLVEFPIYATLMFSVMLAAFLLRPHVERQPGTPDPSLSPGGFLRRAAGLCIDLAPGMMAAVVVFDLDPSRFLEQVQGGDPRVAGPVLFGTAVASAVTAGFEVAIGRSLGKLAVGLRVVALDGSSGTRWQRGLRAGLRFVVLMFWPIGVLALVDPYGRGMPELLTRTAVVLVRPRRSGPVAPGPPPDGA